MAFPDIPTGGRVSIGTQTGNSATRTFPNLNTLTKNSGDLLIAIVVGYQTSLTANIFSSWGGGFTEIRDIGVASHMCVGVAYKISDGTETGTFTVTQGGTVTGDAAFILLSIPGAHPSTAPEVSAALANGTTAAADPAALNPANWDVEDTLWIAVAGSGETGTGGTYTGIASAPTNYSSFADTGISQDAVGGVEAAVAFRQNAVASEDVGTFSVDVSNARNVALVIAVRPSSLQSLTIPFLDGAPALYAPTIIPDQFVTVPFLDAAPALYAPVVGIYVLDTFTDTTNTSLENHTPDVPGAGAWHGFTSGDAFVDASDRAVAAGAFIGAYIDGGHSDGTLKVTLGGFSESVDTRLGLHFRGTDVDEWADHWTAFVYRSADGGYTVIGLEHSVAASGTTDWEVELGSGAISAAGPHELKVTFNGTSIEVFWNGVSQHSPTTSSIHQTETNHGLSWANGGAGWYDDFRFTPPEPGGPATQGITLGLLDAGAALYAPTVLPQPVSVTLPLLDASGGGTGEAAYVSNSTPQGFTGSLTWTMNAPSGIQSGDTLIGVFARSNTLRTITSYPSGWTQLEQVDETVQGARLITAYKIAGGSEPGTYDFTWDNSAGQGVGVLLCYRGDITAPIDNSESQANAADETPPIPAIVTNGSNEVVVGIIAVDITAGSTHPHFTPPSGWNERVDANETVDYTAISVADKLVASAGTTNADFGQPVGEGFASVTASIAIKAPAGGGSNLFAPTLTKSSTISLGLLDAAPALYAPTLTPKNTLTLGLLDAGAALYAPTLTPKNAISLGLLDAAAALYAPTLVVGPAALTIPLLDAGAAVYSPTLTVGPVTVSLGLLDAAPALYQPTLARYNTLTLGLLDAGPALYAPAVIADQSVTLGLLDAGAALYAPTLVPVALTIAVPFLDAGPATYAPTLAVGPVTVSLGLLTSTSALYAPTLAAKSTISLGLLDAGAALYQPVVYQDQFITLDLLDSGPAVYQPVVSQEGGPQTVEVALLDAGGGLFAPVLSAGPVGISVPFLDAGPALYTPTLVAGPVVVSLPLLDAGPLTYAPAFATLNALTLPLLDAGPATYAPVINPAAITLGLALLDAAPALYPPVVAFSVTSYPTGTAIAGERKSGTITGGGPEGTATKTAPTGSATIP